MRAVGIKTLKNKLSEYVRLAAGGETVLVTDRDQVVAELRPPSPGRAEALTDAHLAEFVRRGIIKPPTGVTGVPRRGTLDMTLDQILADLDASREDRF